MVSSHQIFGAIGHRLTRKALCQYIVRAPLPLQLIVREEQQGVTTQSSSPSGFFECKQC
jgi:hypothetical protein